MPNLYLISGNDEFTIRKKASEVLNSLCGIPPEDNPNLEIIHGDSTELKAYDMINEIIGSVNTPAFFGDKKIIWLKRFDFSQISKSNNNKEAVKSLVQILKNGIPEDIILVMDGTGLDRRSALFKACQQTGEVFHFEKVDLKNRDWEQNIRARIMSESKQRGYSIAPDAALFLTEISGTDTGRVVSEIEKLGAFVYPRNNITIEDCKAVCSMTPEAAGWAFADALSERNMVKALDTLNVLFNNKSYGIQVLFSVINRFQEMISIKTAAQKLEIPKNAQYTGFKSRVENIHPQLKESLKGHMILKLHPYRAWMLFSHSAKFADAKLAEILTEILKVNRQLVSGGCDERIALEMLAFKVCK